MATDAHLIAVGGPTASGKSALAVELAMELDAEIINADSRQFFKGLDIGTAKITAKEKKGVPHHFLDFLPPTASYSAGNFEVDVLRFLKDYYNRKKIAILVGGSGLYLQAVISGMDELPSNPEIREKWNAVYSSHGLGPLQKEVLQKDPEYYSKTDINNHRRLIRALEVMEIAGKPFSSLQRKKKSSRPFQVKPLALLPERGALYERIDIRVDQMMHDGFLEEAQKFLPLKDSPALKAVGYPELFEYLEGKVELEEAVGKIKQHSRNYAKRQYTWFRQQGDYEFFTQPDKLAILRHLQSKLYV